MSKKIKFVKCQDENNLKIIAAVIDNKVIGYLHYKVNRDAIWLSIIEVDKKYRHSGEKIGTKLLQIFENDCCYINKSIEGKFYPKGETAEVVKKFYNANGYSVDKEYYDWTVFKMGASHHNLDIEVKEINYKNYLKFEQNFEDYEREI